MKFLILILIHSFDLGLIKYRDTLNVMNSNQKVINKRKQYQSHFHWTKLTFKWITMLNISLMITHKWIVLRLWQVLASRLSASQMLLRRLTPIFGNYIPKEQSRFIWGWSICNQVIILRTHIEASIQLGLITAVAFVDQCLAYGSVAYDGLLLKAS